MVTDPPARLVCSVRCAERGLGDVVDWLGGAGSEVTLVLWAGKPNRGTEITLLPFKDSMITDFKDSMITDFKDSMMTDFKDSMMTDVLQLLDSV